MAKDKKPAGASKLKSGFLWAGAQFAVTWFVFPEDGGLLTAIAAAAGGFVAGWMTTGFLNRLAKWGVSALWMPVLGVLFGVAVASGAVQGLGALFSWFYTKSFAVDLEALQAFLLSWRIVPALALGALSGLYVKAIAGGKKS